MVLVASAMAQSIADAMGKPEVSADLIAFCQGIVDEITQNGVATFGGSASGHTISGITGASLASKIESNVPFPSITAELIGYCTGICNHIIASSIVTYSGPPAPPGNDWFEGGTISGTNGAGMATMIKNEVGFPSVTQDLINHCTGIANNINSDAEVESGVIS